MSRNAVGARVSILVIILVAYLMIVIDMSVVITALPEIRETLAMTATGLTWVQNAYLLAYGGLLLLGARAGDLLGRRRMFVWGVAMFTAASLGVGVAVCTPWLLIARTVQGIAAAVLAPSALALLQMSFPEGAQRTRAIAYYSMMAGIGAMLGLVLGGVFTAWLSWRIGFLVNVPIGVALIFAARTSLSETPRRDGALDVFGAATSTSGMTALVYGLVRVAETGWRQPLTIVVVVGGVALLCLFVRSQSRVAHPLLPLRLFSSRERSGAYAARALFVGAITGFLFFMTLYLQRVLGLSPFMTGLAFLPMMLANFVGALAVPRLMQRVGLVKALAIATTTALIGMGWLGHVSPDTPFLLGTELPMLVIGLGGGASLAPLTAAGISGVEAADAGAASGMVNVAHQLGACIGLAVLVVVFASTTDVDGGPPSVLAHSVRVALVGSTVMLAVALTLVLTLIAKPTTDRA